MSRPIIGPEADVMLRCAVPKASASRRDVTAVLAVLCLWAAVGLILTALLVAGVGSAGYTDFLNPAG